MKLSREVKTGILVVLGILAVIFGFSYLKSSSFFDDSSTFYAVYDNVGGLQSGTQVSINGLVVGNVTSIKFKDNKFQSIVTFKVNKGYGFTKNSLAEIYDTGIIGGKGIQIIPVFDDSPLAISGDTLNSAVKPGITDLVQEKLTPLQMKVEGAVTNADSLLMNVNDVLDARTKLELRQSIAGLNKLVTSFQVSANTLNDVLASNKKELDSSIKNVNTITENFAELSEELAKSDLAGTIKGLQGTVDNLNELLSKIERGEGSLGKLANDDEFYNNLSNASRELDLLLQDFRLNPKRYVNVSVFGKKQKDYEVPENDPAATKEN
ncbi:MULTISPECIES: MlaD family protein [Croceitalea]|uniref:MlaD family protein n=1 Tax=Croceitalea vernalis TaxID=3075599 RepID=A0ABU3BKF6_9FLAO|nr:MULTISPECIES: MlaD family protein [unclassified Croceitalea]MDT0540960.1 MlaD family protein [Croceitalea sp. P059]MDT0622648.1 MlaD family protein [Croceitalea sp. P007]